jgi:hypothetical protein
MNFRLLFHAACDEPQRFRRNPDFASLHPGYDFNRRCEPTGRANARPMTGSAKQSIKPRRKNGLLRRFAPRNDDTDGKRKWQKQPQQGVPPPVNACAEKSRSRSMCPHAGPSMIIRPRAGAPMARPTRPMSEAGASVCASPGARLPSRASTTRPQKPYAASARIAARRYFTNVPVRRTW